LIIGLSDGLTVPVRLPPNSDADLKVCLNCWSIIAWVTSFCGCSRTRRVVQWCYFNGRRWVLVHKSGTW